MNLLSFAPLKEFEKRKMLWEEEELLDYAVAEISAELLASPVSSSPADFLAWIQLTSVLQIQL